VHNRAGALEVAGAALQETDAEWPDNQAEGNVMMTLLEEIEQGAASEEMSLGTLLRKCLILASRLGSKPATDWVDWELNGYPPDVPVPEYRVLRLVIKADLVDFGRQVSGWTVPPALLGENAKAWTHLECRDGVGAIEHILGRNEGTVHYVLGNLDLFLSSLKITEMSIVGAWAEASSSKVKSILDTVRNRVLKFALDLGREYPDAGMVKSAMPKDTKKVDQLFISNIYGPANVVGTANHSNVVLSVTKGDFSSLKHTLEANDIPSADIKELKVALEQEPEATSMGFGPKVSAWFGRMMKAAADGTWKIGTEVAAEILGKALSTTA
jgi:AbiTii